MTEESHDEQTEEPAPFDESPPVDPSEPRVGNSQATFFGTRDDDDDEDSGEDEEPSEDEGEKGDAA